MSGNSAVINDFINAVLETGHAGPDLGLFPQSSPPSPPPTMEGGPPAGAAAAAAAAALLLNLLLLQLIHVLLCVLRVVSVSVCRRSNLTPRTTSKWAASMKKKGQPLLSHFWPAFEAYYPIIELFPALPNRLTQGMNTLSDLPQLQNAETRTNQVLNLLPNLYLKAHMVQMAGVINKEPCGHCTRECGKFVACVLVSDLFGGYSGLQATLKSVAKAINNLCVPNAFEDTSVSSTPAGPFGLCCSPRRAFVEPVTDIWNLPSSFVAPSRRFASGTG
ncbi:MAG: hypothetical protein M1829_001999 [Trizodia sp. TS-e1964]|nr:MAG: hypothetical protein M1829_001999 [Trizodia sp. TS-e1964]